MTKEMCKIAWSDPYDISKTTVENGVFEEWFYFGSRRLYFTNGILTRIDEDREDK